MQTSILDLKEQINQVENSLALLLAETPRRYERGKLADQQLPEDVAVGVPMQMLSNRPDVRAAERSLEQAEENMKVSGKQYEVGLETLSDYLEAQVLWQQAYQTKVDAHFQLYVNYVAYLKAAGQLSSEI